MLTRGQTIQQMWPRISQRLHDAERALQFGEGLQAKIGKEEAKEVRVAQWMKAFGDLMENLANDWHGKKHLLQDFTRRAVLAEKHAYVVRQLERALYRLLKELEIHELTSMKKGMRDYARYPSFLRCRMLFS